MIGSSFLIYTCISFTLCTINMQDTENSSLFSIFSSLYSIILNAIEQQRSLKFFFGRRYTDFLMVGQLFRRQEPNVPCRFWRIPHQTGWISSLLRSGRIGAFFLSKLQYSLVSLPIWVFRLDLLSLVFVWLQITPATVAPTSASHRTFHQRWDPLLNDLPLSV